MPVCGKYVQLPDGVYAIAADPATTDLSTCAFVLQTSAEYGSGSWFFLNQMSVEQSQLIAASIGGIWAIAWGFKQIIHLLKDLTPPERDY